MSVVNEFSLMVEKRALSERKSLRVVLLDVIEESGITEQSASGMLNSTLKEKLRQEWESVGYKNLK